MVVAATGLFFTVGRNAALKLGDLFVARFIYSNPGHPHSLDHYLAIVKTYPDQILKFLSWDDPANICAAVMVIFCVVLIGAFLQKTMITRSLLGIGILFLAVDLYAASFLDIKGDLSTYQWALAPSPIVNVLKQEKAAGRLGRIYGFRSPDQRLPLTPSQNMLYGIEDIGAYSPLVTSRYYQAIGLFGNINDSNFAVTPTPAFVVQRLPILDFLNVSHILSAEKLTHPDLHLIFVDSHAGVFLYANSGKHDTAHFISSVKIEADWEALKADFLKEGFDPARTLLIERSEFVKTDRSGLTSSVEDPGVSAVIRSVAQAPERLVWNISVSEKGFFVLSDLYDRGWSATVNGKPSMILPAFGLFRAVEIEKPGAYRIEMQYRPEWPLISRREAE